MKRAGLAALLCLGLACDAKFVVPGKTEASCAPYWQSASKFASHESLLRPGATVRDLRGTPYEYGCEDSFYGEDSIPEANGDDDRIGLIQYGGCTFEAIAVNMQVSAPR